MPSVMPKAGLGMAVGLGRAWGWGLGQTVMAALSRSQQCCALLLRKPGSRGYRLHFTFNMPMHDSRRVNAEFPKPGS